MCFENYFITYFNFYIEILTQSYQFLKLLLENFMRLKKSYRILIFLITNHFNLHDKNIIY